MLHGNEKKDRPALVRDDDLSAGHRLSKAAGKCASLATTHFFQTRSYKGPENAKSAACNPSQHAQPQASPGQVNGEILNGVLYAWHKGHELGIGAIKNDHRVAITPQT